MRLSKSKFLSGLQCVKKLWLDIHDSEKASPLSKADERILEQGTQVGIEARKRFPSGLLIEYDRSNLLGSIEKTKQAIKDGAEILFEGAFVYDDVLVLVDVLRKNEGRSWDLIEVKSTTDVKEQHIPDLAIQKYVLEGSGLSINKSALMHLNSECVYPDLSNLFVIEDLSDKVKGLSGSISHNIDSFKKVITQKSEPVVVIGPQCSDPYECSFKEYCWEFAGGKAVFNIPSLNGKKKLILQDRGILTLEQLPKDFPLSDNQWDYVQRILYKEQYIDEAGIREKLSKLDYPVHFLDFETDSPAIPRFDGMGPYNLLPFQYSCHFLEEDGTLKHYEYLHTDNSDPRRPLLQSLLGSVDDVGSVVAYNAGFEKKVLRYLC